MITLLSSANALAFTNVKGTLQFTGYCVKRKHRSMTPQYLIIDGYNVLGAMGLPPQDIIGQGEAHRDQFIVRLGLYAQAIHCSITVVFDAWRQSGNKGQISHQAGVTVIYSSQGERADQVIQQLIRQYGQETAVVSSDLEVINVARAFGAFVIRSQEFLVRLRPGGRQKNVAGAFRGKPEAKDDQEDVMPRAKDKKGNPRKLPKKLRQRNRIMKRF